MNWYKIAKYNKKSSVYGEFWIDESGNSYYADGDIGDSNHSYYVINRIIEEKVDSQDMDYNTISNLPNEELIAMGFNQEEIDIIKEKKDPRTYAMKNWGWIRIADRFCQFWALTPYTLKILGDGLYECFGDEVFRQSNFVLESLSNGAIYEPVPWLVISKEDPMLLRQYLTDKFIFSSAKKWYKTAQYFFLYHGSNGDFLSAKDMPMGHRGYFFTTDQSVASKFGKNIYRAEIQVKKLFDGRIQEQRDELFTEYKKVRPANNTELILRAIQTGSYTFYEDNLVMLALQKMGYDGNWQIQDNKDVIRVFNKDNIKKIQKINNELSKTAQLKKFLGYKVVGLKKGSGQAYSIYSKEPININIGSVEEYSGKGLFLGTSKDFCLDYYSCGTADEDDELLLTYEYNLQDIIQGDPNYKNGEIQVKKAILVNIEPVDKGRYG